MASVSVLDPETYTASYQRLHVQELWRGEVQQLSWTPRAFLMKGFLSEQECEYMIGKVSRRLRKSLAAHC